MPAPAPPIPPTDREVIAIEVARRMFPVRAAPQTSDVVLAWLRARNHKWIKNTLAVADYILLREARIAAGIAP